MIDPAIWRENHGENHKFGITVYRNGMTIYYGRSLLRIRWTGQWTKQSQE